VTNYQTWLEDFGEKLAENRQRVAAFILSSFTFRNTRFKIIRFGMAMIWYLVNYWDSEDGGSTFVQNVENTSHCHTVQKFQNRIDIGGMMLIGETEVAGENPTAGVHCKSRMDWRGIEPKSPR